jgi:hypothetical protein
MPKGASQNEEYLSKGNKTTGQNNVYSKLRIYRNKHFRYICVGSLSYIFDTPNGTTPIVPFTTSSIKFGELALQ